MPTYDTVREIGRGGFGVVEEVQNAKTGEHYACKTLVYPNGASKKEMKARFEREVKYQSTIDHPNVVPIIVENLDDDTLLLLTDGVYNEVRKSELVTWHERVETIEEFTRAIQEHLQNAGVRDDSSLVAIRI